jgi:CheY-like chemotaxis protein
MPAPSAPPQNTSLFNRIILVVEDHADSRDLLATSLRFIGAKVFTVGNVKDAERQIETYRPDLVICDMRLPDGTGADFIRWLRARDKAHGGTIPVIAVTAYNIDLPIPGFDGFMRKPIDIAKLCNMAAQLLAVRR